MEYNDFGNLTVRAALASNSLPVEDAVVVIRGADEYNSDVLYSLLTNEDGLTESVALPAPSVRFSETPKPTQLPFAKYDIEVSKDGYYTKKILEIPVFPGINTSLPVNMLTKISFENGGLYPKGNVNATI